MNKRSLKQEEIKPYREFVDSLPAFGVVIGIVLIMGVLVIAGLMMQAPIANGHETGLF